MNYAETLLMYKGEAFVVAAIKTMIDGDQERVLFDGFPIPYSGSRYEFEFPMRRGRADIVSFHIDGTATIIEVKDGSNGINAVLAGIGQVTGYAVQMGMSSGAPMKIRKVLMFTSVGTEDGNENVLLSCVSAGVIPIYLGSYKAMRDAQMSFVEGLRNAAAE